MELQNTTTTNSGGSEVTSEFGAPDSSVFDSLRSPGSIPTCIKAKTRTSPIWDHTSFNNRNDIILNKNNRVIWRCRYCPQEYTESGGTAIVFRHLQSVHELDIRTNPQKERIETNIKDAFARVAQSGEYKRRCLDNTISTENLDPDVLERLYILWLTRCGISFRIVESIEFRAYI